MPPSSVKEMLSAYEMLPEIIKNKTAVLGCKYAERSFAKPAPCQKPFKENNLMVTSGNFLKMSALEKTGYLKKNFLFTASIWNFITGF